MNDQVKNLVQIRKSLSRGQAGKLASNQAFLDFLAIQQQLTAELDKTWAVVQDRMTQYNVKSISGDFGYITMAERKTFVSDSPAPRFTKRVLDAGKVRAYEKLHGKLPEGIGITITPYLSKKIKAVF